MLKKKTKTYISFTWMILIVHVCNIESFIVLD